MKKIIEIDSVHRVVLDDKEGADFQLHGKIKGWRSNLSASLTVNEMDRLCAEWLELRKDEMARKFA